MCMEKDSREFCGRTALYAYNPETTKRWRNNVEKIYDFYKTLNFFFEKYTRQTWCLLLNNHGKSSKRVKNMKILFFSPRQIHEKYRVSV